MSVIHSSWALLGWRSSLRAGTARCSTVRSIAYSRQASASTASPIHSRRPARVASCGTCWSALSMGSPHRRRRQETSVPERPDSGGRRVPGTVAWPGARRRGPWLVGRLGLTGLVDVHVHFLLDAVWGRLAEAGVPVVVHCGSGPVPGRHTGPGPFGEVLRRHLTLTAVIAHLGMPEYAEHLGLPEHPPPLRRPAGVAGASGPGRRLAAGRLLGQRRPAARSAAHCRCPVGEDGCWP